MQALIDAILAEMTASRRRMSSELATLPEAERALREFIAQTARLSPPQNTPGDEMTRTATIDTTKVNQFLAELAARDPYLLDIRRLRLITLAAQLSAQAMIDAQDGPFDDHPGWRHCSRRAVALVRSAAAEDFRLNLLVSLSDLRATASQGLGELLVQDETARQRLQQRLGELSLPEATLEASGVCRVRMALARRQTIALLESALRAPNAEIPGIDWPRLTAGVPVTLTVDGYAVAPPSRTPPAATRPSAP